MNTQLQQLADVLISDSAGGCGGRLILPRLIPDSRDDASDAPAFFSRSSAALSTLKPLALTLEAIVTSSICSSISLFRSASWSGFLAASAAGRLTGMARKRKTHSPASEGRRTMCSSASKYGLKPIWTRINRRGRRIDVYARANLVVIVASKFFISMLIDSPARRYQTRFGRRHERPVVLLQS